MNKEFIPYEQALELKELGFNEECIGFYNPSYTEMNGEILYDETGHFDNWNKQVHLISAPLYQQVFRWFREKQNLLSFICPMWKNDSLDSDAVLYFSFYVPSTEKLDKIPVCDTHEEAELACLKKLIEIAKNK